MHTREVSRILYCKRGRHKWILSLAIKCVSTESSMADMSPITDVSTDGDRDLGVGSAHNLDIIYHLMFFKRVWFQMDSVNFFMLLKSNAV